MYRITNYFFVAAILFLISCENPISKSQISYESVSNYVNPFIGTGGHGHTYPGATVPFGMLQVSPDNGIQKWDWCSGYHYSDSIAIGFSHLHLSGTGIGDLKDIRFMPINKKVNLSKKPNSRDEIAYKSRYSHAKESANAGYYSVYLEDHSIRAAFTSDLRVAKHKYTYAQNELQSVIIDLGFATNWDRTTKSSIQIIDNYTVSGYRYSKGWANNQKVYFVAKFSKPIETFELIQDYTYQKDVKEVVGEETIAQLYFDKNNGSTIETSVALSSVSIKNALENLNSNTANFESVQKKATKTWESQLSKIKIETPIDSLKSIFYTALYHTQIAPVTFSDVNGEFRMANDRIVKSETTTYSTLSLWDTFRAEQPLLTILEPKKVSDIVNSMLVYYQEKKVLPVWTLYGNETNTMTGYHSIPVIAEAYLKGVGGFDIQIAYEAMKTTMMQDERGLDHYKKYGYIPFDLLDESVTITLEYAYNDWCVAQIAKALNKTVDYDYFMNRSNAYQTLFDTDSGFMRGLSQNGNEWHEPFDPKYSAHRVHADYTEGNAWQHSWFVLQDAPNLIKLHGGDQKFVNKLEQLFTESSEITGENVSVDISGLIGQYAHGNEPSHHIAYLFNFANQPWRTQYWVHHILKTQYANGPNGLSGNEDCGQMSAWYVFSAMGLYPFNPVSGNYQIGSPLFEETEIQVSKNKTFKILANKVSDQNIYIQSALLNGKSFNRTYITHQELMNGGTLEFVMGNTPNYQWGVDSNIQ